MKLQHWRWVALVVAISFFSFRIAASEPAGPEARSSLQAEPGNSLEKVLSQMDSTASSFRTAQANFVWEQYQKVIDETETQKGTVYYRRSGKEIQMMADITDPAKAVLFTGGKVQVFEPKLNRVTTYEAGKNREAVESFLVLGFGGGGHDMLKSFDVRSLGTENVGSVAAAKLELIPKSERVRNLFGKIWLWIDPARGVSVQQQFFDTVSGDYRLAKYSDIQLNQKIPDSAFKLKTRSDTQFIAVPKG
jgi:outer membrane lipoprotein-sorting protein